MAIEKKCGATARVTFTVEIPASGSWGDTCHVDQIFRQAGGETKAKLEDLIRKEGGRIVGEPQVVAVFAKYE